jgi:SNF2 family DNA or RNA helicase
MLTIDLHTYQEEAVDRAVERGSLLIAYEMGLGKTPIALAAIEDLIELGEVNTAVIVVPASLKYQWAKQIAKLTDVRTRVIKVREDGQTQEITVPTEEYCILIDGDTKKRNGLYTKVKAYKPDYVIMGYENVVNDWNWVRRIKPECIVLDEATAIKTFKAQRTRKIKRLTAPHRYALTGTPVENGRPEELFSIMQWVDEDVLGRFDLYDKSYIVRNRFGGVQKYKNLPVLHAKLSEAMVRKTRLDDDVRPFLPEVQESNIPVVLDARTRKAYKRISDDLLAELRAAGPVTGGFDLFSHYHGGDTPNESSAQGKIMARMQALDMLLNHPDLIRWSGQRFEEAETWRQTGIQKKSWTGSKYCYEIWKGGVLDDVTTHPKMDTVLDTLERILATPGNKVVVFSVNPDMLELLADRLPADSAVTYTGRMSAGAKAFAANRFETDPECRVFLSSHAGAFGTDLWMANYLINYDLAWSSGKQDQINKRHDRASSKFKNIYVLNAITAGTTEPRKLSMLAHKRRIGAAITDGRGADDKGRIENDVVSLTQCLEAA